MRPPFHRRLKTLRADRRGAAAMLLALSMTALTGAAAISVDLGSAYLARRELQGIADSAVLAAVAERVAVDGEATARAVIDRSGAAQVTIDALTPGLYRRDAALDPAARFAADGARPNAARLTLAREVPLVFGRALLGRPTMTVRATATAARLDYAAFSIGTRLASLSDGLPNDLLSALAGTSLNLSVMDGQGLASADLDLLRVADALKLRLGQGSATYAELFDRTIPLGDIVLAMADAAPDISTRDALMRIAPQLSRSARLADMIDLGVIGGNSASDGATRLEVGAFALLRAVLELSRGDTYELNLNLGVQGLTDARLRIFGGRGDTSSPWLSVTDARDVVIRTARSRIYLEVSALSAISGIASLRVPILIDLAEAEARLSDIACGGAGSRGVTLAVTPSIGSIAIADVSGSGLANLNVAPALQPAVLTNVLGAVRATASAKVSLGGVQSQSLFFSEGDIAAHASKTVSTGDLVTGVTASLVKKVDIAVTILGITVHTGPVVSALGAQLGALGPVIDPLLGQLTGLLGVRLGEADVRVDGMRCGVPLVVA